MLKRWLSAISRFTVFAFCFGLLFSTAQAQDSNLDEFEVYLDFRHRGVINTVVISYYKGDAFYLPVSELFSLFNIDHKSKGLLVSGDFGLAQVPYKIDLQSNQIDFGNKKTPITADDYIIKELDNYLRIDLFNEVFGLGFTVDFNNLTLNLETEAELPAIESAIRQQLRSYSASNEYLQENYELRYDRERPFIDGGFLDYNLTSNVNTDVNYYNASGNIGMQLYGGDLQGSILTSYSQDYFNYSTNNLRWRYKFIGQSWLTNLTIGQTSADGLLRSSYTGIRLSNEPIEPRRLFDEFEIQGSTIPQSEVELYMNNALIDYQRADELGKYRFLTPITYGSSQLDLKIFGPTGQVITRAQRIQVPFKFQPQGVFNYTVNAGRLDNPLFGNIEQPLTAQGSGAFGLTKWLTANIGAEYFEGYNNDRPTFTSSLSSRILKNYIVTLESASDAYYRGMFNVVYPNSASLSFDYTEYIGDFGLYNPTNDEKRIVASAFYPFNFWGLPFNLRASTFSRFQTTSQNTTIRLDANTKVGKSTLRVGYSDRYVGPVDLMNPTKTSYIESSMTYNISQNRSIPALLRGYFLRAQMRYRPVTQDIDAVNFMASRGLFQNGRMQFSYGYNFEGNYNTMQFSLIIDLDKVRNSSSYNSIRNSRTFTQNFRGSIGYDTNYNNFILTGRDQVGRSGTAVKLFVDNNTNNKFDAGDDTIEGDALRILSSGSSSLTKNGILYFTQMRPYYFYNMEMNKSAIKNPMLVPEFEKFGLITDPNRFKKVEIPFYLSGVIEGSVERQINEEEKTGVSGLKLYLENKGRKTQKEIRTFSDGSFYDYEMPPGDYKLSVDPAQLDILNSRSIPEKIDFEVEAKPEGDFIEGLAFLLVPATQEGPKPDSTLSNIGVNRSDNNGGGISLEYNISVDSLGVDQCRYGIQLGGYSTQLSAQKVMNSYNRSESSYIVFNRANNLYIVRAGSYRVMNEAANTNLEIQRQYPGAAVFNQCNGTLAAKLAMGDFRYDLQFAAFSNPQRAQDYINDFNQRYGFNLYRYQDPITGLFKVRMGPFTTLQEAQSRSRELISSTTLKDIYITKAEVLSSVINADFDVELQLGSFDTIRKAVLYAIRVEETFDLRSRIIVDEQKNSLLFLDKSDMKWQDILNTKDQISKDNTFQVPVVHLKEMRKTK